MPFCPICERKFDTKNGLQGHFRFKHRYELGQDRPATETPFTRAIGENIERRVSGDAMMKAMRERDIENKRRKEAYERAIVEGINSGMKTRGKDNRYFEKVEFE